MNEKRRNLPGLQSTTTKFHLAYDLVSSLYLCDQGAQMYRNVLILLEYQKKRKEKKDKEKKRKEKKRNEK